MAVLAPGEARSTHGAASSIEGSGSTNAQAMLDSSERTNNGFPEVVNGVRTKIVNRVGAVVALALVLAAAVLCLTLPNTQEATITLDQVTQACPPPCVPHVFSQREEAELTGSLNKGKMAVPSGDEAVEEAMRAASDANGQIRLAKQTVGPSSVFQSQALQAESAQSQWSIMHNAAPPSTTNGAMLNTIGSTPTITAHAQSQIPSAGTNMDESIVGELQRLLAQHDSVRSESARQEGWESRGEDAHVKHQLRSLSKPQLRSVVRALLRNHGADRRPESSWAGEPYRERDVHRLREAMDHLVERTQGWRDARREDEEEGGGERRGAGELQSLIAKLGFGAEARQQGDGESPRAAEEGDRRPTSAVLEDLLRRLGSAGGAGAELESRGAVELPGGTKARAEELVGIAKSHEGRGERAELPKERILEALQRLGRKEA